MRLEREDQRCKNTLLVATVLIFAPMTRSLEVSSHVAGKEKGSLEIENILLFT